MDFSISDVCAIVPAAGFGFRMKTKCPKQYLLIDKKTILEHSVSSFIENSRITQVIIVINPNDYSYFKSLVLAKHPKITMVNGGLKRSDSVLAGMKAIKNAQWVLVHDANRPCLHQDDLLRLLKISKISKVGGILAAPVRDTIKQAEPNKKFINHTVSRNNLWHAMTPQFFPKKLFFSCLLRAIKDEVTITDEASVLEYSGFYPLLIKGRSDNIKITHPEDLLLAKLYLTCKQF